MDAFQQLTGLVPFEKDEYELLLYTSEDIFNKNANIKLDKMLKYAV